MLTIERSLESAIRRTAMLASSCGLRGRCRTAGGSVALRTCLRRRAEHRLRGGEPVERAVDCSDTHVLGIGSGALGPDYPGPGVGQRRSGSDHAAWAIITVAPPVAKFPTSAAAAAPSGLPSDA